MISSASRTHSSCNRLSHLLPQTDLCQQEQPHHRYEIAEVPDCSLSSAAAPLSTDPDLDDPDDNQEFCVVPGSLSRTLMLADTCGSNLSIDPSRTPTRLEPASSITDSRNATSILVDDRVPPNPSLSLPRTTLSCFAQTTPTDTSSLRDGADNQQFTNSSQTAFDTAGDECAKTEMASSPSAIYNSFRRFGFDRTAQLDSDIATGSATQPRHHAAISSSADAQTGPVTDDVNESQRINGGCRNVPKLDRTMTDIYSDELYSPNFAITSTSPLRGHTEVSPSNDLFSQRINAANSQHLNAAHSPSSTTFRTQSPFRTCSPFVSSSPHATWPAINQSQRSSDDSKLKQAVTSLPQPEDCALVNIDNEPETPKTISPKDAILEFSEAEADINFPLFPPDTATFTIQATPKDIIGQLTDDSFSPSNVARQLAGLSNLEFPTPQTTEGLIAASNCPSSSGTGSGNHTPPRLSSSRSNSITSESNNSTTDAVKPPRCGITPGLLNTQAGPHRCDRINPSTGKSCNTVFSRPYDLTRHEDTIHNARKQKVRCDLCAEEKTFSRADALTRHYRVCHPDVDLPGVKHKRRGGH
ncbi:hypothetical protein CDD80_2097 [Ophiocordyceps camponoti-rufipedis]|uniref:C2H2-type domain-containing protein n=1 Tax=Ophiocordyceps camponoti-rufipedis TaxID=2004952 RepID=A0A2C5ZMU1_9HYPO|nr:hypothetical protein CDD80_2097 [Ophiocordyceps camponoti-rufipedis]